MRILESIESAKTYEAFKHRFRGTYSERHVYLFKIFGRRQPHRLFLDLFGFAPIDCNSAESRHATRVSDVIDSVVFYIRPWDVRRLQYVYSKLV